MTCFAVFSIGLELGHRHRLGQFGHLRQPFAVGRDRFRAGFERERIRLDDADPFVAFGRRREEALRPQRREQPAHPLTPAFRHRHIDGSFGQQAGHRIEIESTPVRRADRGLQPLRAQAFLRVTELRAEDVGQFHDQLVDFGARFLRLLLLLRLPGVPEQAERHRLVAVDDFAIGLQRGSQSLKIFRQCLVILRANASRGGIAKLRQRPCFAFREQLADLALEPRGMFPYALSVTVRRDLFERAVEQSGERLHRFSIARRANEHERKIVAQRRKIAVAGKNRRMQVALGKRIALALGLSAREMKRDVRLKFYLHAEVALVVFRLPRRILRLLAELCCPLQAAKR